MCITLETIPTEGKQSTRAFSVSTESLIFTFAFAMTPPNAIGMNLTERWSQISLNDDSPDDPV